MQQGSSQSYGAPPPDMNPFATAGTGRGRADHVLGGSGGSEHLQQQQPGTSAQQAAAPPLDAASPIASRPPPRAGSLDELGAQAGFPDEDALVAAGEEAERVGAPGNRWPRQETLALLKIRSEMDATFRDATLKAPLWEDVSRKLAELGYRRSAKKCKEKFENVHKYYKRTKDGRAGRQDGKSYRFFSQLEALHSSGGGASSTPAVPVPSTSGGTPNTVASSIGMVGSSSGNLNPTPLNAIPPAVGTAPRVVPDPMAAVPGPPGCISFSATSSSSASESEEDTEEGLTGEPRKRKRRGGGSGGGGGGGSGRKMMAFFEELMRQVMERQEAMQQRFLEAIEKREQDRMIREEAWKRQEVARITREHEMMAQERAMSASRDSAIIAFLQNMTGQTVPVPAPVPEAARPQPPPQHPPPAPVSPPPPEQTRPPPPQRNQVQPSQTQPMEIVPVPEAPEVVVAASGSAVGSGMEPASSRWPKSEVHALIKLRTELEIRYQEAGPKGPLWEEIATRMQRLGYNRSAKRCKEKWENINKYFKKVKESNKKRPEDSKTCPYFHELDALYRRKVIGSGSGGAGSSSKPQKPTPDPAQHSQLPPPLQSEAEGKSDGGGNDKISSNGDRSGGGNASTGNGGSSSAPKAQTSNGGIKPGVLDEGMGGGGSVKKPEDIVKELMDQRQHHQAMMSDYDRSEELDGNDTEQDGDEDDELDDEDGENMGYRIHYQKRASVNGTSSNGGGKELAPAAASFMAMMQ